MNCFARLLPISLLAALSVLSAASTLAQQLEFVPLKKSAIYAEGERVGWTVKVAGEPGAAAIDHNYTIKENDARVIQSGKLDLTSGEAAIETKLGEPGMLYLEVFPADAAGKRHVAGAAVAPTKLQPVVPCPADFDAFWQAKIALLHQVPAEPVLTPGESDKPGVEYATIKLNNIGGSHIYGQIAKPAREGKFPALLLLQWAGGPYPLQKTWVTERAAEGWLTLNIEPHDVPGDLPAEFYAALPQLIKSYNTIYDDDRDRNYFLRMYLGAYRAADYLASRADWDGKILVAMGTSMGGQQSLAVSGLHPKITHMIVHVPAGADSNAALHGRAAGYPNWDKSRPKVMETALYFDTVNFAARIKATSLVTMGFLDEVCPPVGIWTAFNQIPGRKEVVPLPEAAHNHQSTAEQQRAYTERSTAWLAALVHGAEAPVQPGSGVQ